MDLRETLDYAASPDLVFAMLCDKSWRERVCQATHASRFEVRVDHNGGGATVRTSRTMPAEVPDAIRRVVVDTIEVVQTERWGSRQADGSRKADLLVEITGQPARMKGTLTLKPTGTGTRETVTGDLKVRIPILGRKVEPEIAKAIRAALAKEGEVGRVHLSGR